MRFGEDFEEEFQPATYTTENRLYYIHSDLWGPATYTTHGEARYFLTLIDDLSIKVSVYMLKTKDKVFDQFIEWRMMIENRTDRKIKFQ